ncbi:dynein light chain type 1 family protein [Actinidia rufa]|uniref:Dynein light chain type 1 family protein n=1 Tax=Actinidia rufa TaxID=165716 RepID=A0A7J0FES9_9ERIC|nr:dynein light chain type 1 family protein [Actinidia rufa]
MEAAEEELERRSKFLSNLIQKKKAIDQQEQHNHLNVRVRASDMRLGLQNRAFACARDNLDSMPGKKLDSKKLALALKKIVLTIFKKSNSEFGMSDYRKVHNSVHWLPIVECHQIELKVLFSLVLAGSHLAPPMPRLRIRAFQDLAESWKVTGHRGLVRGGILHPHHPNGKGTRKICLYKMANVQGSDAAKQMQGARRTVS